MGVLTVADILKQGAELAGTTYDSTDAKLLNWLKQWLRSVALGWAWPETIGYCDATLAAGVNVLEAGTGKPVLTTTHITRIEFPIKINYGEGFLPGDILQDIGANLMLNNTSVPAGTPNKASYTRLTPGTVKIVFNRKPSAAIALQIQYQYDPSSALITSDIPWYMNDDTMIHAVAHKVAEYHDGKAADSTRAFADSLSVMLRNDKLKFGNIEHFDLPLSRRFAGK